MIHQKRMFLVFKTVALILPLLVCTGCFDTEGQAEATRKNKGGSEQINNEDPDGNNRQKSTKATVWDERFEIFMEHPFVVANSPTEFVTHITERKAFRPRREGPVTFVLSDESGSSTRHVEQSPKRDGIYIPALTFPRSGRWQMSLVIAENTIEHVVQLPALNVYGSQDDVNRAQAPEEISGISFLKEQQWKMPFKTQAVQRRTIRSQDVLAVPESAILDDKGQSVAFVQLSGETFIKRYLKLGESEDGFIQIVSGLTEGEQVVTKGGFAVAAAEQGLDYSTVKLSDEDIKRFGIKVDKVTAGEIDQQIRVPGEIVINSDRLVHIVPHVPGIVQQVKKNLGDFVNKGEVMAVIESRELADIKAAYLTSIEAYKLTEPYFKREEKLWEKKISSEQEYLDAKKALSEATIEMNKAKYKLRAMGFSLEYIEKLPSEPSRLFTTYEITAPFSGTITNKHITLGEVVKEDKDIFVVANLDNVWVDLRIPQKDASSIKRGQKVIIFGKADAHNTEGTIDYVHLLIDEQTRTILARVVLDNTSGQFLPGTFVTATILVEKQKTAVVVEKRVLQDVNDRACVFVQNEYGFEPRPVMIGRSDETCVEIIDGLESGELIATENSFRIKTQLEKAAAGEQTGHGHAHLCMWR